jgi:protein SCO1/2
MRFAALAIVALMLAAPVPACASLFAVTGQNLATELKTAEQQGRHLAVYFELPDCSGCRVMKQNVFTNQSAERDFGRLYHTVAIDLASSKAIVDTEGKRTTPMALAQRLRIVGTPAFAFFDREGVLNYRHVGTLGDPSDFIRLGRFVGEAAFEELAFADYRQGSRRGLYADASPLPRSGLDFALRDQSGRLRHLSDFRGKAVALAVGYMLCPDVCPTTLSELKAAVEALGADSRHVQVLFATLDPERDSQRTFGAYVTAFRRDFLALRGTPDQTADFIRRFSLVAEKQPSASMGYTLDHTAGVFLFDHTGQLRGLSPYGQALDLLADDLKKLAREARRPDTQLSKR